MTASHINQFNVSEFCFINYSSRIGRWNIIDLVDRSKQNLSVIKTRDAMSIYTWHQ